jgi:hypothetical protein
MIFIDAAEVTKTRVTKDGYLVADARVSRVGLQTYTGAEVGKPELALVTVYRPEEEVFNSDSIASYAHRPVTVGHPAEGVTAKNWRDVARGSVGGDIVRDGGFVRVPMTIMDQAAIDQINAGTREISMGYHCRLEFADGETPDGKPYQAIQRDLRMNHAAIVPRGRAGAECRIGDSWSDFNTADERVSGGDTQRTPTPHKEMVSMKTLTIDGHSVALDDAAFIAVSTIQKQLGTAVADALAKDTALATALKDHAKALSDKDGEVLKLQADHKVAIDAKDAEIADLKTKVATPEKIEAAAEEKRAVVDAAKPILGATFDAKGKTVADIRRAAVAKLLGDAKVEGKTDEHVAIAFDTLTTAANSADPLARAVSASLPNNTNDAQHSDPHARRIAALQDAWKQAPAA